jgi:hypothetical protein
MALCRAACASGFAWRRACCTSSGAGDGVDVGIGHVDVREVNDDVEGLQSILGP